MDLKYIKMDSPLWQVAAWIITGLLAIVTFFSQFAIRAVSEKLKSHDEDIKKNAMDTQELKSLISNNSEIDKLRMETIGKSFDQIARGITEIKQAQSENQREVKSIDRRLTDFIIETHRSVR
jgi:hypothetical protein